MHKSKLLLCVIATIAHARGAGSDAAPDAEEWCPHAEREGRLRECLSTRVPPFVAYGAAVACLQPCLAAALRVLGAPTAGGVTADAAPAAPSILLSVGRRVSRRGALRLCVSSCA